ncbi:LysR family transcriptional regulator [Streptomyces sp. 5.8]|uniref:LysR family transcriptional regulator n=1 Tax=Streptomyces sp. 5.8 TaxID=3406571 RepID=UPI003BB800E6
MTPGAARRVRSQWPSVARPRRRPSSDASNRARSTGCRATDLAVYTLEVRHLQVLRSIAQEGSLAGAARALHYSQPTITHHLATMEAYLGAPLVQRGPRGALLTELGESLLPHAEAVLDAAGPGGQAPPPTGRPHRAHRG